MSIKIEIICQENNGGMVIKEVIQMLLINMIQGPRVSCLVIIGMMTAIIGVLALIIKMI